MSRTALVTASLMLALMLTSTARTGNFARATAALPAASASPVAPGESADAVPVSLTIENSGDDAETLIGGFTPVADRVDVHLTRLIDGRREMSLVAKGVVIPPASTIVLEPGAAHLMLVGLREPLIQGDAFLLTLRFAPNREIPIQVRVRRKVDAAGLTALLPVTSGDLTLSLASAPPAPAG